MMAGVMVISVRLIATAKRAVRVHRMGTFFSFVFTASLTMKQQFCHMLYLLFCFVGSFCSFFAIVSSVPF